MKHKVSIIYSWFIRLLLYIFPDIPLVMRVRGYLYSLFMVSCGKNFQVAHSVDIKTLCNMKVGNNVYIGNYCVFLGKGFIDIKDDVMFGPFVLCVSGNHSKQNGSYRNGVSIVKNITINSGSWIGGQVCILAGAEIPQSSVIGANSVVNSHLSFDNGIYAGSPVSLKSKIK